MREIKGIYGDVETVKSSSRSGWAMADSPMLEGTVEVDETYGGGIPRNKGRNSGGHGMAKTPVAVLVERDSSARPCPSKGLTALLCGR